MDILVVEEEARSKIHCGGGGGGSNFCKANICHSSYINNEKDYSGYKIFKKNDTNN